jgi:predicted amidophosphoribosyltransferase
MKFVETKQWRCMDCMVEFESTDEHHNLDMCPLCRNNGVDHESYCIRLLGNVREIKNGKYVKERKMVIK